jgi:hypothetical protein
MLERLKIQSIKKILSFPLPEQFSQKPISGAEQSGHAL